MSLPAQLRKITIAIDGHSSCGKSTLARDLARELNYIYVDTGAMYRGITLKIIRENIDLHDLDSIKELLNRTDMHFIKKEGMDHLVMDGEEVESEIRTTVVAEMVSPVSEISVIRRFLVDLQRKMGQSKGIVMEGRDIGTVVFPDAELKLFVTADLDTRTERRFLELTNKGYDISREMVKKNLSERDHIDSTREDSPLCLHPDAILIDTSNLTRETQLARALELAFEKINSLG